MTIPKAKAVKRKVHRNIPNHYILKSVTISQTPSGRYFASILFAYEKEIIPVSPNNVAGLDFTGKHSRRLQKRKESCHGVLMKAAAARNKNIKLRCCMKKQQASGKTSYIKNPVRQPIPMMQYV